MESIEMQHNDVEKEVRIFLSYAHKDGDIASQLEKDLQHAGIYVWRDLHDLQGGHDWEEEVRGAIRSSLGVLYVGTSAARASKVIRGELRVAKAYKKAIFPVFATGMAWPDAAPLELIPIQYIDVRGERYQLGVEELIDRIRKQSRSQRVSLERQEKDQGMTEPNSKQTSFWQRIAHLLQGNSLKETPSSGAFSRNLGQSSQRGTARNPYKGLQAFTRKDAQDFFGRDEVVASMIEECKYLLEVERREERTQEPRFLTVVGPSGSGKSSVVMAGLLPCLQKGEDIPGSASWVLLPEIRPGEKPLETLAQALAQKLFGVFSREKILSDLQDPFRCALHSYAKTIAKPAGSRVILFVDQFEELFTQSEIVNEAERDQFLHQLITAATEAENKVMVIVTLRADFSDYPMHYPLLHRMLEAHRIAMPPMSLENLHAVIEEPANLPDVELSFEENLIGDLLFDIRGREENLPLLQFTLTELFKQRNIERNCLTHQAYRAIGGVGGALNQRAEETYHNMPSEAHRRLANVLFTLLINPGGLGQDATRRRVPASVLTLRDPAQNRLMQETLGVFIQERLITANRVATSRNLEGNVGVPTYEISHEVLISAWKRLTTWVTTARDDMLVRRALESDIERWEKQNRAKGLLYVKDRLKEAEDMADRTTLTEREEDFLQASIHRKQQQQIVRLSVNVFSLLLATIVVIAGWRGFLYYRSLPSTTVTTTKDAGPGSLRRVIQDAQSNSTITFDPSLSGQEIVLTVDLDITKNLTVDGPDALQGHVSISSKRQSNAKVHILPGAQVTFDNLIFRDSHVSRTAFIENQGNLTLKTCLITNNTSDYDGGGITNLNGVLSLTDSEVSHNRTLRDNGGGIYSWDGPVTLNHSNVLDNSTENDGGGIYELSGGLTLSSGSTISGNTTTSSNPGSNGGGISVLNGQLSLNSSTVSLNTTHGYGGGIALLGTTGVIARSIITDNTAPGKGSSLAVEKNSESGLDSVAALSEMELVPAHGQPMTSYFIMGDILQREQKFSQFSANFVLVLDDSNEPTGSPASKNPAEKSSHFLGTVDLDRYCHALHPHETISLILTDAEHIQCVSTSDAGNNKPMYINPQTVCQSQYHQSPVVARLADYYDPSSWQCYRDVTYIGDITRYLDDFCRHNGEGSTGANHPGVGGTAYDWSCRDKNNQQSGIAITNACQWKYGLKDAFDVLVEFADPNGWACYAPSK